MTAAISCLVRTFCCCCPCSKSNENKHERKRTIIEISQSRINPSVNVHINTISAPTNVPPYIPEVQAFSRSTSRVGD